MILVVNFKDFGSLESIVSRFPNAEVVYIGRAMRNIKASVLGNPFFMKSEEDRDKVIEQYRQLLWQDKKKGGPMWDEVLRLSKLEKDIVLVCWCAPKKCHGDIVKAAVEWVRSTQQPTGINIFSGEKGLGAALTNPTILSKRKGNIKKDYPVEFRGKVFPDAETAYQETKRSSKYLSMDERVDLMAEIICAKFRQHPELLDAVKKEGGADFLSVCWHRTYTKTKPYAGWEGIGLQSPMIRALVKGYQLAN